MSRARALLAAVPLLALVVGGCSGDPEPKFEPTPSARPTASTPASPHADDPEAAVAAWIDARNAALVSGDLTAVRALTAPTCSSCEGILDPIAKIHAAGGHFDTNGWRVAASKVKSQSGARATVSTGLDFAGGRTVASTGAKPVVYQAEHHIVIFRLVRQDAAWRVNFVGFLS